MSCFKPVSYCISMGLTFTSGQLFFMNELRFNLQKSTQDLNTVQIILCEINHCWELHGKDTLFTFSTIWKLKIFKEWVKKATKLYKQSKPQNLMPWPISIFLSRLPVGQTRSSKWRPHLLAKHLWPISLSVGSGYLLPTPFEVLSRAWAHYHMGTL